MPHPVLCYRATKRIIQTPPVLGYTSVFILQCHSLRSIRSLAQSTRGAFGSVTHSLGRGTQSQHCWDLPADTVPSTLVLHHLCQQGKRASLGSSSHLNLLMQTGSSQIFQVRHTQPCPGEQSMASPKGASYALLLSSARRWLRDSGCWRSSLQWSHPGLTGYTPAQPLKVFLCSYHQNVDFCIKSCNCGRYGTDPYCFTERTLSCKGVHLGNSLQQWGSSWIGVRAEAGRAPPGLLRAECALGLCNPLQPKMLHESFTCSIFKSLGWKWEIFS